MPTTPPTVDEMPPAPQRLTDGEDVYAGKADTWAAGIETLSTQLVALGDNVHDNAVEVYDNAVQVAADKATAVAAKGDALAAQAAAEAAQAAAEGAAGDAAGFTATSTTEATIADGALTLTIEAHKQFTANTVVRIAHDADNFMIADVDAYDGPTGQLDVVVRTDGLYGEGTYDDWTVSLSGETGPAGSADFADQAEAEAGTSPSKVMSPLRTAQAIAYQAGGSPANFGDGSDGDVTVSGSVSLSRDMFYRNLTVASGAALDCRGYRIFVSDTLDLSAAPAGGITANGGNGGGGTNSGAGTPAGGTAGSAGTAGSVGVGVDGKVGGLGNAGAGGDGAAGLAAKNGGVAAAGGDGGSGSGNPGTTRAGGAAGSVTSNVLHRMFARLQESETSTTLLIAGASGGSGAAGGSDGSGNGPSGGGSGAGGGIVQVAARYIKRGPGTAAGAIQAKGGDGGNGGSRIAGNIGGAGGGGGGGGGWVYLVCQALLGAPASDAVDVSGGDGGDGGTGASATYKGGYGGGSGAGGRFTLVEIGRGAMTETLSSAAAKPAVAPNDSVGGTGQTANVAQFDL